MQIRRFVQNVSGSHRAVERACRGADLPRGGRGSRLPAPSKRNRRCLWRRKGYQRRRCRCHDRISGRVASLHRAGGRGRLHARRLEVEESCVRRRRGIRWNVLRSACSGVRDGCARFLRCGYPRHRREIFCLLPSEVSCSSRRNSSSRFRTSRATSHPACPGRRFDASVFSRLRIASRRAFARFLVCHVLAERIFGMSDSCVRGAFGRISSVDVGGGGSGLRRIGRMRRRMPAAHAFFRFRSLRGGVLGIA